MTDTDLQQIQVPLTDFIREVVREATVEAWKEHRVDCPIAIVEERLRKLELKGAVLVGYMVGAGLFGGGTAAVLVKVLMG